MVISMEVLGDHQIYPISRSPVERKIILRKTQVGLSRQKSRIFERIKMVESMLMEMGESKKELSDMKYYSPEVNI